MTPLKQVLQRKVHHHLSIDEKVNIDNRKISKKFSKQMKQRKEDYPKVSKTELLYPAARNSTRNSSDSANRNIWHNIFIKKKHLDIY